MKTEMGRERGQREKTGTDEGSDHSAVKRRERDRDRNRRSERESEG